jgi:glyoxylase-like metal-dependent hydrolase (beta-lactamase superfamily II)
MGICSLREFAKDLLDKPVSAVATHAHIDHIGSHHEFEDCIAHRLEAEGLRSAAGDFTLADPEFDPENMGTLRIPETEGYKIEGAMITALPSADYDIHSFRVHPAKVTRVVEDGDTIDLGDRTLEVLHLPGHSPGSIGLLERRTDTLFSGDAIYDGPLIDNLHHSNLTDYEATLRRLLKLPVKTIHAGHDQSFGRDRLVELIEAQFARWR